MAIIFEEPEFEEFLAAIDEAQVIRLSAASYLEAAIVLEDGAVVIEPVSIEQARLARQAFREFGKGYHRARLNFGDCSSYALAKTTREPLRFKGNDFSQTDLEPAVKPLQ